MCASAESETIVATLVRAAAARGEAEVALRVEAEAASQAEAEAASQVEAEAASQVEAAQEKVDRATTARALVAWMTAAAALPREEDVVQSLTAAARLTRARQHGKQPLVWAPWGWNRQTSRRADS